MVFRFGKSNAGYVSWVIIGILGTEVMTGWVTDTLWTSLNYGKTYETVDWSKFKSADDEEEEEGMYDNETFYRRRIQVDIIISRCSDLNTYTIVPLQKKKQKRKQMMRQKRMEQTMMMRRKSRLIDELK